MSSLKRVLSSRANGARSRGPVTPAGKQASSLNAIRHGLLARCVVLKNESRENFDILMAQHLDRYRPADDVELSVLEEMASAFWRMRRLWAIETRLFDDAIRARQSGDEIDRMTGAFTDLASSPQFALLHRYEARLHHIRQRAFKNIHILRNTPPSPNEPTSGPDTPDSAPDPTPAKLAPPPLPNEPTFALAATPAKLAAPELPNEPTFALAATPAKLAAPELPNEPTFVPAAPATPEEPLLPSGRLYLLISRGETPASDDPQPAEPQADLLNLPDLCLADESEDRRPRAMLPAPAPCPLPSLRIPEQRRSRGRDCGSSAPPATYRMPAGTPCAERPRPAVATSPLRHHLQAALAPLRRLHPNRSASNGPRRTGCRRRPPPPNPQCASNSSRTALTCPEPKE